MLWIFAFLTLFYKKAAILSAIIHFGTPLWKNYLKVCLR
jgi:hypothetical protein